MMLTETKVVEVLIEHAKKEKCPLQENAAIALARLSQTSKVTTLDLIFFFLAEELDRALAFFDLNVKIKY